MSPDELEVWLCTQLDEDERIARAAAHGASGRWVREHEQGVAFGPGEDDWPEWSGNGVVVYDEGAPTPEQAEHIASNDPARVLREVEAKRLILVEHRQVTFTDVDLGIKDAQVCWSCHGGLIPDDTDDWDGTVLTVQVPFPCKTVRLLALPYADRPGYRDEWRP